MECLQAEVMDCMDEFKKESGRYTAVLQYTMLLLSSIGVL